MARLVNINPIGAVELPLIGRVIEAGEEFEVPDDAAAVLLEQVDNYRAADGDAVTTDAAPAADPAPEG